MSVATEFGLPDPVAVDLGKLAEPVWAEPGASIIARNPDCALTAASRCIVTGQADWLRVLVRDLVDNPIRCTPAGGRVRVIAASDGGRCRLCVSDSGPGIPASERDAVLRRFHHLDQGDEPGSGLGLAIVARIADLHGATLTLADDDRASGLLASVASK